jgi:hypothetical protein
MDARRANPPRRILTAMSSNGLAPRTGPEALAVVFTSLRTAGDHGSAQTADEMIRLAAGKGRWYRAYRIRVSRVEREYGFER